jgi:small-conductance mechanosensitive channel
VVQDPPPLVLQTALGDFGIEYRLRARTADVQGRWVTLSALHAQIQDAFNAAGVQIMTPHYEGDPESAKIVPRAHWEGTGES